MHCRPARFGLFVFLVIWPQVLAKDVFVNLNTSSEQGTTATTDIPSMTHSAQSTVTETDRSTAIDYKVTTNDPIIDKHKDVHTWHVTQEGDYSGKSLHGHTFLTLHTSTSNQCAMECLKSSRCLSFNYNQDRDQCGLNDVSHTEYPEDLIDSAQSQYHSRMAYSIKKEALGPCGEESCNKHGRCLEARSADGVLMAICLCDDGWLGTKCQLSGEGAEWAPWMAWSSCSASCHRGWKKRRRHCVDTASQQTLNPSQCFGAEYDFAVCELQDCPRWEEWGDWGECSTLTSCGQGIKVRRRVCGNGGTIGVDRYCLGLDSENTPCMGPSCDVAIDLSGGQFPGEGVVELYDRQANSWKVVCADQMSDHIADLVCRQVGWPGAHAAVTDGTYTTSNTNFGLRDVQCKGSEKRLMSCKHNLWESDLVCQNGKQVPGAVQCNVNGVWSLWSSWSTCDVTCENGTQTRTRSCDHPPRRHGGKDCKGESIQHKPCSLPMCPMDGVWLPWSNWTECSLDCGGGQRTRNRNCSGPLNQGKQCEGPSDEVEDCNTHSCPVDGQWMTWQAWGQCSLTCGGGQQKRLRECKQPLHGGEVCEGEASETRACNEHNCPINGTWKDWSDWSECSVTCAWGIQWRNRTCDGPFYEGAPCDGDDNETQACHPDECPVDGHWMDWGGWQDCSVTCGGGKRQRIRVCYQGKHGGQGCTGSGTEEGDCNTDPCPVDGQWLLWSEWGNCSLPCGSGVAQRTRLCDGPYHGGANCTGPDLEDRPCNTHDCAVDGEWEAWSSWGNCSLPCGTGTQERTRDCNGPFNGGKNCEGERNQTQDCNVHFCPIDGYYQDWNSWGPCSETCGGGQQQRERECVEPLYGGADCVGPTSETQACSENPCPIDGYFGEWSDWSQCSQDCGGGLQWRNRTCIPQEYGGNDCVGLANVTQNCNRHPCPIDGEWLDWSEWSECNTTCGGGLRERRRACKGPKYGGKPCEGVDTEYISCNENPCPIPGEWLPWRDWTPCTVTCDGGTRYRNRDCDMTVHGNLTDPCVGPAEETVPCHTFDCLPLARTCTELGERGLTEDTEADIDVDGPGKTTLEPVKVFCDMTLHDGIGVTVIGHDQEQRHQVQGWEGALEYEVELTYNISFEHVVAIVDQSDYCEQYISWECFAALIHNFNDNNRVTTGWLNRTKGLADYFGGASPGSESCACGMNHTCAEDKNKCNCDSNDQVWRQDEGYLTYKDDLPVFAFVAGDTGEDSAKEREEGFFAVGPISCHGLSN